MDNNNNIRLGDKKRNYREGRKTAEGKSDYPYTKLPHGRVVKIVIGMLADEKLEEGNLMERDFRSAGVFGKYLMDRICTIFPWFKDENENWTGNDLTPKMIYDRMHKQYYWTGPRGCSRIVSRSDEHYTNDPKLRPLVPAVDRLFRRGTPITIDEAFEAGSYED